MIRRAIALLAFSMALTGCGCSSVAPGHRGVKVTTDGVSQTLLGEGLNFHAPIVSRVEEVSVQQQVGELNAECFSSDMQTVTIKVKVLYKIPEGSVIKTFQEYAGNPFDALVAPRVYEAVKELTALESAEAIVKTREALKVKTLEAARRKIGNILIVEDVVIENIKLSPELEKAIESKMVQEQESKKSIFIKEKAAIEADTLVIKAEGEAKAMNIRAKALKDNPQMIDLILAEKWNGVSPQVTGGGAHAMLPLGAGK